MAASWPSKANYATGDVLTAANMNQIGDNLNDLYTNPPASSNNFYAGKNKIINGDFGVWQRGTSFTNPAGAAYTADRFCIDYSTGTVNCVVSQQAFTAGTAPVSGYESQYFLRISQSAATAAKSIYFGQRIEDVRSFAGQTVTFSFWAKANASKTLTTRAVQNFGSGGSSAVVTSGSNNSITTSWARYSNTITIPSIASKTLGAGSYILFDFYYDSNAIQDIDIWGFQVEVGSTATPFQTATGTKQGELAACQRYFQIIGNGASFAPIGTGSYYTTTDVYIGIPLKVTMRTAPSATYSGGATGATVYVAGTARTSTATATSTASVDFYEAKITTAADTAGRGGDCYINQNATLSLSSEL